MVSPFFSIIIPAFNAEKFILESLNSVSKQTFQDFEIVLVDDGSQDLTNAKASDWKANHPEMKMKIISQVNRGIGGARNSGIKEAIGEFVSFLDADDRWRKNKLNEVARFINENPEFDFVCHDEFLVFEGKRETLVHYGPHKTFEDLLFNGNCISTSATSVRREKLLQAGLFSENMDFNGVEDYELWLRLSRICNIGFLHLPLGEYNIHDGGISRKILKHTINTLNVLQFHFGSYYSKPPKLHYLILKRKFRVIIGAFIQSVKNLVKS